MNAWTAGNPAFQGDTVTLSLCFNIFVKNVASVLQVALPKLQLSVDSAILGQPVHLRSHGAVTVSPPTEAQQGQPVCYNGHGKTACFEPKEVCIKNCQTGVRLKQAAEESNAMEQALAKRLKYERR